MAEKIPNMTPDMLPPTTDKRQSEPSFPFIRNWERTIRSYRKGREGRRDKQERSSLLGIFKRLFAIVQNENGRLRRRRNVAGMAIELANRTEPNTGGIQKAKPRELSKPWRRKLRRDIR